MTPPSPASNVYYLTPPAPATERPARAARGRILHLRLLAFWWQLRIATADVMAAVRRFGRTPIEADAAFLEQRADLVLAVPSRRRAGPARIIDFAAARTRLRA